MHIHGYPWISMHTHGYPWVFMDIHRYLWIPMDLKFMSILASLSKKKHFLIVSLGAEQSLGDSQRSLEDYMTDDKKILGTIFIRRGTKVVVVTKEG